MSDIVMLHNHTGYSILDGYTTTDELPATAKKLGHDSTLISDHGSLAGHRPFQKSCGKYGIRPLYGVEAYLSPTDRFDRSAGKDDSVNAYNHLIIIAKSQLGLKNLNKLTELSWVEGFYNKNRIDREILTQYSDDLIILSGCLGGVISEAIEKDNKDQAYEWVNYFKETFGPDFYIELQPDNPVKINKGLYDLANEFGVTPIITADTHFPTAEDRAVEECQLILSSSPKRNHDENYETTKGLPIFERLNKMYPDRRMTFEHLDLYLQNREPMKQKMLAQGIDDDRLYDATLEIADKVEDCGYANNLNLLPKPKSDPNTTLRKLVYQGLKELGIDKDQNHIDRVETELKVIADKDFPTYFLMIYDMVKWAKSKGIRVGPGRGSCISSDVCYTLGITTIDPLKYGLLFFRFIDPNRPDWPDIDIDVQDDRRNEVIDYLKKKFVNVASISNYNTFGNKNVVRDVARVLGVPLADVNKVLKGVHKFEDFENDANVKWFHDKYPEVLQYSRALRGRIRNVGIHASGIVISNEPIENYAPIETRVDDNDKVSGRKSVIGADMHVAEEIGLLKIDILGLKTLSVIDHALKVINERHGINIDLGELDLEDEKIYQDLSEGRTVGVFQADATAYTKLLKEMKPENFSHLILSNALVRPGAANTVGPLVINRMHGVDETVYIHPIMKEFTEMSYGLPVFQEDIMLTCTKLAGMSMADASAVRKIIGKKLDVILFEQYKEQFVDGAAKNIPRKIATKLWHDFEEFAKYGFNKAHSVGYSLITYWTAWLKHYYPIEYMYALLSKETSDKIITFLLECKRLGISVTLPHINLSQSHFSLDEDRIIFGLSNIKYLSDISSSKIIKKRPFESYHQFLDIANEKYSGITSRMIGALNNVGAAAFDDNPRRGDEQEYYWEYLNIPKFTTVALPDHVTDLISPLEDYDEQSFYIFRAMANKVKRGKGWSRIEFVDETGKVGLFDKEESEVVMGQMYLIAALGNKLVSYMTVDECVAKNDDTPFGKLLSGNIVLDSGEYFVLSFSKRKTKQGRLMGFLTLVNADLDVKTILCFPNIFPKVASYVHEGEVARFTFNKLDSGEFCVKDIIM